MANEQILVVEDEGVISVSLYNILTGLGYAVPVVVASGEEAIQQAAETRPDLVLMDIRLAGELDGVEAAGQIRARLDVPVVYLTAYADDVLLQRAKITEPYSYLVKPIHSRELYATIEIALYRHKLEKKLKESERWLATTLRSIGDAVIATDEEGCVTFMNPVAEALTGWKQEEALGRHVTEVFHIVNEETRALAENPVTLVLSHALSVVEGEAEGKVIREGVKACPERSRRIGLANHTLLIARDGTETPIDGSAAPIRDDKGDITGVVLVFRDITERKRAEEALRESEERYRIVSETVSDWVYADRIEPNGAIVSEWTTEASTRITGFRPDEVHAHESWLDFVYADDHPIVHERTQALLSGKSDVSEYRIVTKSGAIRWVRDHAHAVWDQAQGRLVRVYGAIQDITERKQAEEALARRAQEMAVLYETSLEINSQPDIPTLLHAIVQRAAGLLEAQMGALYLVMPDSEMLELVVSHNLPGDYVGTRLHLGEGLSGRIAQTGQPMTVSDHRHWEGRATVYADEPFRRVLGVPLKVGNRVIGVINVTDDERTGKFDEEEIRLVSLFADQAAIAVENNRLFQAEREQRQLAEALEEAAAVVSSTLDLGQVLDHILEQVERVVAGDTFSIMLIQEEHVRTVGRRGYDKLDAKDWMSHPVLPIAEFPILLKMVETGEPALVLGTAAEADWVLLEGQGWLRSYVGAPIQMAGSTVGILNVNGTRPGQFGPADARRLEAFASHAATAIENARLYEQARRDAETKATLLQEVNHRVKNNLTGIIGLLYAERRRDGMEDQPAYQSLMDDLTSRVQGLARVHDMLSAAEWAPLPLDELTRQIIQGALQMLPHDKRISVDVTPSPVRVTPQQVNSLALMINELATNTLKYALPERRRAHISVRIALGDEDDAVLFEFRDDGPGYPAEVLQLERHNVGLYLIQIVVRDDLEGELALHNEHGAVTTVRFKKDP